MARSARRLGDMQTQGFVRRHRKSSMQVCGLLQLDKDYAQRVATRKPDKAAVPNGVHAAAVLASHFEQGVGDLPQRADAHGIHQHVEHVLVVDDGLLQALELRRAASAWRAWKSARRCSWLFFFVGGAGQFQLVQHCVALGVAEGVDADDGVLAGVLEHLVVHALFLDLAALVAGFHGPEHAAAVGDLLELGQNGLFHQFGEFLDDEGALVGFSFLARPHSRLMMSWMAMARRTESSVGVVMASSNALVCRLLQLS